MKKAILLLGIIIVGFGAPNLLWLTNSTLKIRNDGDKLLSSIIIRVDEKETKISDMKPGQSRFIFLTKSGESTVTITYNSGAKSETICHVYVEEGMYHVEVEINSSNNGKCKASLPIVSELFLLKLI